MITRRHFEPYSYIVVYLPDDLAAALPLKEHPRLRVRGVLGATPFALALQPASGNWYLLISQRLLKQSGYEVGDRAMVRFRVEPQDKVDVPEALIAALNANPEFLEIWKSITPGKQRGIAYRVAQAKAPATIAKRVEEAFDWLARESVGENKRPTRARRNRPAEQW